jgi:hypothetical protein
MLRLYTQNLMVVPLPLAAWLVVVSPLNTYRSKIRPTIDLNPALCNLFRNIATNPCTHSNHQSTSVPQQLQKVVLLSARRVSLQL